MKSEAISIDDYVCSEMTVRFNFIYENYPIMENMLSSYRHDIIQDVMDMKTYNKRAALGDLGVRIQVSIGISNPTQNQAIAHMNIAEAVDTGFLDDDFFEDTDDREELIHRVRTYHRVAIEFKEVKDKLKTLKPKEQQILKPYMMKEITMSEIADELGIGYQSAAVKVGRIKKKLIQKVEPIFIKADKRGYSHGL